MSEEGLNETQRWTAKRRAALIVSVLRGETSAAEAARSYGLTLAEVEDWKEKFLLAGENALRARPRDEEAQGRADQEAQAEGRRTRPGHGHHQGGDERPTYWREDIRRCVYGGCWVILGIGREDE